MSVREQLTDFPGFQINIKDQLPPLNGFRNAYDIERKDLLDQVISQTFSIRSGGKKVHTVSQNEQVWHYWSIYSVKRGKV